MLESVELNGDSDSSRTVGATAEKLSFPGSLSNSGIPKCGWRLLANLKSSMSIVSHTSAVGSCGCRIAQMRPIRVLSYGVRGSLFSTGPRACRVQHK